MNKRLLGILLVATACQSAGASPTPTVPAPQLRAATPTPVSPPTAIVSPAPTQPSPVALPSPSAPVNLSVTASDGARLTASYYSPVQAPGGAQSAPGVLLLHMLAGCACRQDWDPFARELQKRGIAALALDLRGYGESAKPADWTKAPGDVRAAWDVLVARPEVDAKASAIVGASMGANLGLIVGANNADVLTVVGLSPGLDYFGVKPAALVSNFGQRPVLLVASRDDAYSYTSVQSMAAGHAAIDTHYFATAGHGTAMFSDPALQPLLLEWLQKQLGILKG